MGELFGTDGVRGIANRELTADLAFRLAQAGATILGHGKKKPRLVVGTDTRISADMLESALVAGLCSAGCDAICVGVVPTPAVAYLTRRLKADGGVVISASHNPVEYNGIKFFNSEGYKLEDEIEEEIEDIVLNNRHMGPVPVNRLGRRINEVKGTRYYIDYLKGTVKHSFEGMKIAVDCANGAAYKAAPAILKELGAEVRIINNKPTGLNINVNCGSTYPNEIKGYVRDVGADVGLAFDGDADRLIAIDNKGEVVDGDYIMAICGRRLKEEGRLAKDTIVATVMSNLGLHKAMNAIGCRIEETAVGDKYVLQRMKEKGYNLGGEQSGHIIFLDYNTTGDGILSALQLLEAIKISGKSLSELRTVMHKYPQVLVNARVENSRKDAYKEDVIICSEIERIEEELQGKGRLLIRPSGTEPLIRIMIEGENLQQLQFYANNLAKLIESRLGQ